MNYGRLRDEIQKDPKGIGYAGMTDEEVADSLNAKTRERQTFRFSGADLINAVDQAEWNALSDAEQAEIKMLIGAGGSLDASENTTVRDIILSAFGVSSTTVQNLIDIATESISRAREIRLGETVRTFHVEEARGS